jgi:hypothetical protein
MLLKPPGFPLPFPLLLAEAEIAREAGQSPLAVGPDATELKEYGGVGCARRIGQQAFKLIEPLLRAKNQTFLRPQLIGHPLPLTLELRKLAFQLGAIPEQTQKLVVIDRLAATKNLPDKG